MICPDCGGDHELEDDMEIIMRAYAAWKEMIDEEGPDKLAAVKEKALGVMERIIAQLKLEKLSIGETIHVIEVLGSYHVKVLAQALREVPHVKTVH